MREFSSHRIYVVDVINNVDLLLQPYNWLNTQNPRLRKKKSFKMQSAAKHFITALYSYSLYTHL